MSREGLCGSAGDSVDYGAFAGEEGGGEETG